MITAIFIFATLGVLLNMFVFENDDNQKLYKKIRRWMAFTFPIFLILSIVIDVSISINKSNQEKTKIIKNSLFFKSKELVDLKENKACLKDHCIDLKEIDNQKIIAKDASDEIKRIFISNEFNKDIILEDMMIQVEESTFNVTTSLKKEAMEVFAQNLGIDLLGEEEFFIFEKRFNFKDFKSHNFDADVTISTINNKPYAFAKDLRELRKLEKEIIVVDRRASVSIH